MLSAALFSMLLTAESVGGAELTLGGIDHSKFKGGRDCLDESIFD